MRRRCVLGHSRRRADLLPQYRDCEPKGGSLAQRRLCAAIRRDADLGRFKGALRELRSRSDQRLEEPAGRRPQPPRPRTGVDRRGYSARQPRAAGGSDAHGASKPLPRHIMTQEASKPVSAVASEPTPERSRARRFGVRSAPLELRMLALAIIIAVALS